MKALINREVSPLTFERYETFFRHTEAFMKWKFNIDDIDIKKLNYEFIADYEFWLKSERKCDHNTTSEVPVELQEDSSHLYQTRMA